MFSCGTQTEVYSAWSTKSLSRDSTLGSKLLDNTNIYKNSAK